MNCINVKTIYNDVLNCTSQNIQNYKNYESDQIIMNCIDLTWNDLKCWVTRKTFKTTLNYKSDQNYNDLHAIWHPNEQKCEVANHSKQRKTVIKIQWLASIWRQNEQKCSSYVAKHSKLLQNSQSDQLILNCIDLTSKRSKMLSYVAKHSKQR